MPLIPDPTFYPSPGMAMQAAPERIAYVALLNVGKSGKRDAMGVISVDPRSSAYGQFVGQVDFPDDDNELHHFGWNVCSACLCPQTPAPSHGASLSGCAGHRLVPDSHPGYQRGS
jgi:methanethiol oxidase